jgi:adenylate cyclase
MGIGKTMRAGLNRTLRFGARRALGVALLAVLLALRVWDPAPITALRFSSFDLFQQIKPRDYAALPVTIVDIDDASLAELGQWPWPRDRLAEMIDRIRAGGAAAAAFDILFAEPDRLSPARLLDRVEGVDPALRDRIAGLADNDVLLAEAMARFRVVSGQTSVRGAGAGQSEAGTPEVAQVAPGQAIVETPHAVLGEDPTPFLQKYPTLLQNLPVIEAAAAGHGMFSTRPDPDGIYRRAPLVLMVEERMRLGLAPELLRVATGGDAFAIRSNAAGVEGVVLARQLVTTAADGSIWTYLTPSVPARYVSAADVITGRLPEGRLAGQLVLIGTSAIGLEDFRPTPLGVPMAGVEIHAQVLENILSGSALKRPNTAVAVELVVTALLGLVVIILVPAFRASLVLGLAVVVLGGYLTASWLAFAQRAVLLDPSYPVVSALLVLMMMSGLNYMREERMRRQIRTAFGQYVSPDLVDRLAENPEALTLGGERRELTLLFSDVRGFTSIAESYRSDPHGLTVLMNHFLTALSKAILGERGTIDKFMGDAVMAFWNAPLDTPAHPAAGCRAALRMLEEVDALNAERQAEDPDALVIEVGIGLSTGPCTVGNMGSDTRFDYTAMGDTVNLASRLEGLSKTYGLRIIVSDSVADEVVGDFALIEVDVVRVKGKSLPVHVFGLMGGPGMLSHKDWPRFEAANRRMRAAYEVQDWEGCDNAAAALAEAAASLDLEVTGYLALYAERVAAFRAAPPEPDWDGVFVATSK